MAWADAASLNFALLCASLMAALLAAALLALEFFGSRRLARQAPGMFAAVLAVCAVVAWLIGRMAFLALGSGSLAALLLVAWSISFERSRQWLMRSFTPKVAWAVVLGLSMVASRFLAAHVLIAFQPQPGPRSVDLEDLPVRFTTAFTDQGRPISLFHFKIHSTDAELQQFIDAHEKDRSQIIRLQQPNPAANCHGWVFTGGQYGIRDPDVRAILADNRYALVEEPREGDLAIYTDGERFTHSGLVRMADRHAPVLIESKWGPLGVYLHAVDKQPFSGTCKFYRHARDGHLLTLRRTNEAVETVSLRSSSRETDAQ